MLANRMLMAASNATPFSYVYTAKNKSVGNASSFNFTSTAIGDENSTRIVTVGLLFRDTTSSGVTINGVTATRRATTTNASGVLEIWDAPVPTGTSVTVAVSLNGTAAYAAIQVFAVYGANSTPTDTGTNNANNSSGPITVGVDVNDDGALLGFFGTNGGGTGHTWTLPTEESGSDEVVTGNAYHSAASDTYSSGGTKTVSASVTSGPATDWLLLAAISYGA